MSRYALEWVKRQTTHDTTLRLLLLLLGDAAEGKHHRGIVRVDDLADAAGETLNDTTHGLTELVAAGLMEASEGIPSDEPWSLHFRLPIPDEWRTPTSGRRSQRDSVLNDLPTAVYRLFNEGGDLLYVGITNQPKVRFKAHAEAKPWWPLVAVKEIVWYDRRTFAAAEEVRAIAVEGPLYNAHDGRVPIVPKAEFLALKAKEDNRPGKEEAPVQRLADGACPTCGAGESRPPSIAFIDEYKQYQAFLDWEYFEKDKIGGMTFEEYGPAWMVRTGGGVQCLRPR